MKKNLAARQVTRCSDLTRAAWSRYRDKTAPVKGPTNSGA